MADVRSPVYVILNHAPGRWGETLALFDACLEGGASMVQLRLKEEWGQEDTARARGIVERAQLAGVPVIINDWAAVAKETGADGVHVGLEDVSVAAAREALGPRAIVGATTPTPEIALAAERAGASYVAVGSVYPSPTRPDKPVVGIERVREVAAAVRLPVCAIGGITVDRVPELVAAGASLLCVISAATQAPDPAQAIRRLADAYGAAGGQPLRL